MAKKTVTDADGNYNYVRKTFTYQGQRFTVRGRTEKEARDKQYQLMRDLENGVAVKQHAVIMRQKSMTGDLTVSEYSDIWLETYIKPKVRKPGMAKQKYTIEEKSYDMYVYKLSGTILPAVGDLRLHEVVDTHLQKVLNDEKYKGRSKSHCEKVKIVMNAMFRQAVKSRLISYNPAEDLIVTAEEGEGHRSITAEEREIISQVAKTHRCGLWIRFLLSTGLRPGESAPLQVSDLDFTEKLVRITKSIESGTENIVGPPKSKAGIRCVPLRDDIAKDLQKVIEGKHLTDFVFPQTDGKTMMTTTAICNNWRSFSRQMDLAMGAETTAHGHIYDPKDIDKNGIPLYPDENGLPKNGHKIADDLVLYCLRHTFCTDLQKAGVPLNIARIIMGHEDIRITASIYTHTDSEDVRAAGEILNSYFSP